MGKIDAGDPLLTFVQWQALGLDGRATLAETAAGRPTGSMVRVYANRHEKGRAHVAIFNWDGKDSVDVDLSRREGEPGADSRKVDIVTPSTPFETRTLEPVEVSDVEVNEESVGFTVSRTGVPILVRVSYFPNWTASGADGPYRVAPNMMVVVPTSNEVRLEFRPSLTDRFAYVLTVVGIGLLFWFRRRDRRSTGIDPDPGFSDGDDGGQGPEPGGKPQVNAGTGDADSEFA